MSSKFTIRDILVYFISGFLFFSVFIFSYPDFDFQRLEPFKSYVDIFGIAILPVFYILGHFVHAVDVHLFSATGTRILSLHQKFNNRFTHLLHKLFNGHRIRGIRDDHWEHSEDFDYVVSHCSDYAQYSEARYWSYLNDTFKGYIVIFFVFAISNLTRGQLGLGLTFLVFALLFRQRGRFFGVYYVQAISRIYKNKKELKNI